ncbi:hypothetical protein J2S72_000489 [Peptoniphilus koenoeneniae]|uniref:Uncharacterized protein n=1 Tax=Peptoniphilus koenoeneniae TaxID=507751 RepID=A0ABU0AT83_9FIRM|nr:hypothetical protein [Peptoniphilus koenoeneniae]MDQ0274481.1 hypothetical protein [Peptoniphilus koenoeneniae]
MKKMQKILIFIFVFLIVLGTGSDSYAFSAKLEKKVKLNKSSFLSDMAVHKGKLYYTDVKISNQEKDSKGNLFGGSCDVKVYERDLKTGKTTLINSYDSYTLVGKDISFKVLSDGNLYMIYHLGGGVMGHDIVYGLTGPNKGKNILSYNYGNVEFDKDKKSIIITPTGPWDNGNIVREMNGKIYSQTEVESYSGVYFLEYLKGKGRVFSYADKYSALRGNTLYLKKDSGKEDNFNGYDLIAFDLETESETWIAERIHSMFMGKDEIYFLRDIPTKKDIAEPQKMLYKYDLKSKETTLLSKGNNPYYDVLPIDGNVFFTDFNEFSEDSKKPNLFMAKGDGSGTKKLYSNVDEVVSDGERIAVVISNKKGSNIDFVDGHGKKLGKISVPQTHVSVFLSGDECIVWSWQNRSVNYYKLNK